MVASLIALALLAQPEVRRVHAAGIVVTNTLDSGTGSLRQAIFDANANPGTDTITFAAGAITGPIKPLTELPNISQAVIIDGTSAPGYAGAPLVEIDGSSMAGVGSGIVIASGGGGSVIKGLDINSFSTGAAGWGIVAGGAGVIVESNYLGVDLDGTTSQPNRVGIRVAASGVRVGGTLVSQRNVISANTAWGIEASGSAGVNMGGVIQGNFVGLNAAGTTAVGNGYGIYIIAGGYLVANNVISGNTSQGVVIDDLTPVFGNTIQANFIGTIPAGTAALPNWEGIWIGSDNNLVGGPLASQRNIISGNTPSSGVRMFGSTNNTVQGNYIGLNAAGTGSLGNAAWGVAFEPGANSNSVIGNVISANSSGGVLTYGNAITIRSNYIGTNAAGTASLGTGVYGIALESSNNVIGGLLASQRNVIAAATTGTAVSANGNDNTIQGNYVGTNAAGTAALANSTGVGVFGANNLVGGTTPGARNIISGNTSHGVVICCAAASGNLVQGNFIGTDVSGIGALGNGFWGVKIDIGSTGNVIGGVGGAANIIANSGAQGVFVTGASTTGNRIRENSIYNNATAGITLSAGGNASLAAPVITGTTPVTGTACASCTIDVFTDAGSQGRYFEGTVTADGAGNWSYYGPLTSANVTATATNGSNNTSQFSTAAAFTPCSGTYCLTGFWTLDFVGTLTNFCSIAQTQSGTSTIWGTFSCTTPALGTFTGTFNQATRAISVTSIITTSGATFALSGTLAVDSLSASGTWICTAVCIGNSGTWTATRPNSGASNTVVLAPNVPQTYDGVTITTPPGSPAITATFQPLSAPFTSGYPLRTQIQFEPSGLDLSSFNPPYVTVSADYSLTPNDLPPPPNDDVCALAFYSLDETTSTWQYESTVTACNTAAKTFSYRVYHFSFRSGATLVNADFDGLLDYEDNCWATSNPNQLNSTPEKTDLHVSPYNLLVDDFTNPISDGDGDACDIPNHVDNDGFRDNDWDNDGIPNNVESPGLPCASASAATDPKKLDTDGDRALDGAECALGSDPMNAGSKPPAQPAGDTDHDSLPDAFEAALGTDPRRVDTDGDKINDGVEYIYYNTDPLRRYTDTTDGCSDGQEIASVLDDKPFPPLPDSSYPAGLYETIHKVNATDLLRVAKQAAGLNSPNYRLHFDINKDGKVDSTDLLMVAKLQGTCGMTPIQG